MASIIERVSHFFADNKPLSLLVLVVIALFGMFAFLVMPKQYNPEIIRPAFFLTVSYEGSTPETALQHIGYELIEQLRIIKGVDELLIEIEDGATIKATVIFEVGEDATVAKSDILTTLSNNESLAVGAVKNVSVTEVNPETIPVLQVAISSPTHTVTTVRRLVEEMRPAILSIPEVSDIVVKGGEGSGLFVEVSPEKLVSYGLSITDVTNVLSGYDTRLTKSTYENKQIIIDSVMWGGEATVSGISQQVIAPGITVGDIATVYAGETQRHSYALYRDKTHDTTEVVMVGVAKKEGSSAPQVTKEVREVLERTMSEEPFSVLSFSIVSDDGLVASKEINGLTINLLQSIAIVAVVLFMFLSARAALVVLITVPLTFLAVLVVGYIAGETINRITLFALILSLGLLVDASIVVVDIIYEHLKRAHHMGRQVKLPVIAAEAVREVGVGLVLSAVTSVVVFLPMFYITGMMGPYMGPIAFFVPVALIASLLIAIILTPFIAISLLKADEKQNSLAIWFQTRLQRLIDSYTHYIRRLVNSSASRRRLFRLVLVVFIITLCFPLFGLVHFQMLPKADRDQLYIYIDLPQGVAREVTLGLVEKVASTTLQNKAVLSIQSFVAGAPLADFNGMFKGSLLRTEPQQATMRVNLLSSDLRDESSTEITSELRQSIKANLGNQANFVRLMEDPPGPPVQATFVAKVSGETENNQEVLLLLRERLEKISGVTDVDDSLDSNQGVPNYRLETDKLLQSGVSSKEALTWYELVSNDLMLDEVTTQNQSERIGLYLTLPSPFRQVPAATLNMPISTENQSTVALGSLFRTTYGEKPDTIYLEEAKKLSYITAEVENRSIVYVMVETIANLLQTGLPGYQVTDWDLFGLTLHNIKTGETVDIDWGGEWEMTLENFRDLGIAMGVALFLVYAVLVAQYRSYKTPSYILLTVPLALIGILSGFLVLDQLFSIYLTATALIGFIALIGIVVNNAIIYLEYVDQAMLEGTAYGDALVAAGAMRLRPILATSLTTVLGALTIVSDPVWSGLAWSIVFGLSLSTFLTLIVFPAFLAARHTGAGKN